MGIPNKTQVRGTERTILKLEKHSDNNKDTNFRKIISIIQFFLWLEQVNTKLQFEGKDKLINHIKVDFIQHSISKRIWVLISKYSLLSLVKY